VGGIGEILPVSEILRLLVAETEAALATGPDFGAVVLPRAKSAAGR
jgi:hypothetical protein